MLSPPNQSPTLGSVINNQGEKDSHNQAAAIQDSNTVAYGWVSLPWEWAECEASLLSFLPRLVAFVGVSGLSPSIYLARVEGSPLHSRQPRTKLPLGEVSPDSSSDPFFSGLLCCFLDRLFRCILCYLVSNCFSRTDLALFIFHCLIFCGSFYRENTRCCHGHKLKRWSV